MSDAVTPRPIAASEHVELRAWTLEDAEPLLALVEENRDFLRRWLPWVDTTRRVEDELEFLRAAQAGYADGSALQLAIAAGWPARAVSWRSARPTAAPRSATGSPSRTTGAAT